MLKETICKLYNDFLIRRHKFMRPFLLCILILSLIIGAGYRSIVLKENFEVHKGFGIFLSMASNFWKTLGSYNFKEYLSTEEDPDSYVYTDGKLEYEPTDSIRNEIGWSLILNLILKKGVRGLDNLALTVSRYQVMMELFVIIIFFWVGKRIAGSVGACLAPFLYSIFKMPMVVMSWVGYYYWTIPFSALSFFFWAMVYRPEDKKTNVRWKNLSFFIYGIFIGFAGFTRLYFVFLPLFMSPLIFIRERALKRGSVLLALMLFGQSLFLGPQILITRKYHGRWAISTRGGWHGVIQGLGAYQNPWGIKNTGDLVCLEWVMARGGPNLNEDGMDAYEKFCKREVFRLFRERPDIFARNALSNIKAGMTISPHFFRFFGISDDSRDGGWFWLNKIFPWLILSALLLLLIVSKKQFWIMLAVFFQSVYLMLVVLLFFPNYIPWIASYIPAFVLLLAMAIAVYIKLFAALIEGSVRCWINNNGIKNLPEVIVDCYREDWSAESSLT